jgi:RHS repeat-associated protein
MARTYFFWDPLSDNILQERDETGAVTAEYTAEPGLYGNIISQNRCGVESQFHYDAQGSTLAVTDDDQNVTDTFAYTAFGEITERTGSTVVPFQYIGQKGYYTDSLTGQIIVRERPYEPVKARWLSHDRRSVSTNGYVYANNRPVVGIDPSGAITILPVSAPADASLRCGGSFGVKWLFVLDSKAPCDGFIVQQVLYVCRRQRDCTKCPLTANGDPAPVFTTYWEAWKVEANQTAPSEPRFHTDFPTAEANDLMCGEVSSIGIVRFFCQADYEKGRGIGNLDELWSPKGKKYGEGLCTVTATDIVSKGLPAPSWWLGPAVEGPAFNFFTLQWDCCPCPKKNPVTLSARP